MTDEAKALVGKLRERAAEVREWIISSQRVVDLLAPEKEKFDKREAPWDTYTVRMSVDHQSSIRTQTKEVEEYEQAADLIETQAREIERLKEAIKVQASAVRTLQANEATEINTLRQQKREWYHAVSSLDSEREANAILTTEIERLREAIHMAMLELGSHGACPACFNAHSSLRDAFTKPGGLK